ncbi:hypothetical protein HJ590_13120 [Naumannella sp. ID2617S]|nr:hypothetical protein [Naumannella sp. ID2617S]
MKRTNLHENPGVQIGRELAAAKRLAEAAHTRPSGVQVLRPGGDVSWERADGTPVSVRETAAQADQLAVELAAAEVRLAEARQLLQQAQQDIADSAAAITAAQSEAEQARADAAAATGQASTATQQAQDAWNAAVAAQATADNAIRSHGPSAAPPWPNGEARPQADLGDLWLSDTGVAHRWDGSTWVVIPDEAASAALAAAQAAQADADQAAADAAAASAKATTEADRAKAEALTAAAATAQQKADAAKAAAITAAAQDAAARDAAIKAAIDSRGTDLITNGTGLLGNNTNFTSFVIDKTDVPVGASASFYSPDYDVGKFVDEMIPFDPSKRYRFSFQARQRVPGVASRAFGLLAPHDQWGQQIQPYTYMFHPNTTTTLAADLKDGDTVIRLTSAANWYGASAKPAGANTHQRSMIIWGWTDPNGRVWPEHTYSRRPWFANAWADGGVDTATGVITLRAPWSSGTIAAGTKVSNGSAGNSYVYMPSAYNTVVPETWTTYADTFSSGVMGDRTAAQGRMDALWDTGMPPGTAKIKIGWLLNRNVTGGAHAFASVSFSDASAAQQAAADAAADAATRARTYAQSTAPTGTRTTGDIWIDTSQKNLIKRWSGTAWVDLRDQTIADAASSAATANTKAQSALDAATAAQATADGAIRTYYQTTPPWADGTTQPASVLGDMWFDADDGQAYRWNGASWQVIEDSSIAVALAAAQSAQTTADGKIDAFYQPTQPTTAAVGDLWYDTDDKNRPYYCSSASPLTWTLVADGRIADAQATATTALTSANGRNARVVSTYDPPASTDPNNGKNPDTGLPNTKGDTWWKVDSLTTRNTLAQWGWSGTAWVPEMITGNVVAWLDVVKLTASTARMAQVAVERIIGDAGYYGLITTDLLVAGQADIGDLVAQKFSAALADIIQARIENLTVTEGATISDAVIQKLSAQQISSREFKAIAANGAWSGMMPEGFIAYDETGKLTFQVTGSNNWFSADLRIGAQANGTGAFGIRVGNTGTIDDKATYGMRFYLPSNSANPSVLFGDNTGRIAMQASTSARTFEVSVQPDKVKAGLAAANDPQNEKSLIVDDVGVWVGGQYVAPRDVSSGSIFDLLPGRYYVKSGVANVPSGAGWGLLTVERIWIGSYWNWFYEYRDDLRRGVWTRTMVNGTPTEWVNMIAPKAEPSCVIDNPGADWSLPFSSSQVRYREAGFARYLHFKVRNTATKGPGEHYFGRSNRFESTHDVVGTWALAANFPDNGTVTLAPNGNLYLKCLQGIGVTNIDLIVNLAWIAPGGLQGALV